MERYQSDNRGKRQSSALRRLVRFAVFSAMLFLAALFVFRVQHVEIVGDSRYTDAEILDASGFRRGSNILLINIPEAQESIETGLPFVGRARIERGFPNRVRITVEKAEPFAAFAIRGGYVILDENAKILEVRTTKGESNLISLVFDGEVGNFAPGEILELSEDQGIVRYLRDFLPIVRQLGFSGQIATIDFRDMHEVNFCFMDRFTVYLNQTSDFLQNLRMLSDIYDIMNERDQGVINLNLQNPNFRPIGSG